MMAATMRVLSKRELGLLALLFLFALFEVRLHREVEVFLARLQKLQVPRLCVDLLLDVKPPLDKNIDLLLVFVKSMSDKLQRFLLPGDDAL